MNVKATKPFVARNGDTGELTSVACGEIIEVSSEYGATLISDGLAEAYTLITPTGTKSITQNGEVDVTTYASANVAVPQPSGSTEITANGTHEVSQYATVVVNVGIVTILFNANGGTGTIDPLVTAAGNANTLNDGSALTAPEGKTFAGWGATADATVAVPDPYIATASATLYAIWADA